jgi:hypothetical protein
LPIEMPPPAEGPGGPTGDSNPPVDPGIR